MTLDEKKVKAFDMNIGIAKLQTALKAEVEAYQALANEIVAEEQEPPIEE